MKMFFLWIGLLFCGAAAALEPDLVVGGYGQDSLKFHQPTVLASWNGFLLAADGGNGRIVKIGWNGQYAAETDDVVADFSSIAGLAVDAAGMIYVSGRAEERIVQFAADLHVVFTYEAASGMLAYDGSGGLFILNTEEMLLWRFRLATQTLEEMDLPAAVAKERPLAIAVCGRDLWILTEQSLVQCDLFGTARFQMDLPQAIRNGALFGAPGDRLFLVADLELCEVSGSGLTVHGRLPTGLAVGGVAVDSDHFWVSDKNGHRLLRFPLPQR